MRPSGSPNTRWTVTRCASSADISLSVLYREVGRLDEAEAAVRALQVLAPDWDMKFSHARTLLFKGEAQAALDLIPEQEGNPQVLSARAMALHDLGRQAEFEAAFAELREQGAKDHPDEIARVYAWTGEADAAFEWLEKSTPPNRLDAIRYLREPKFRQTAHRSALARLAGTTRSRPRAAGGDRIQGQVAQVTGAMVESPTRTFLLASGPRGKARSRRAAGQAG